MERLAVVVNRQLDSGKPNPGSIDRLTAAMPDRSHAWRYSSWHDYSVSWPEPNESTFEITFTPDPARGLTDVRVRTVTFNRSSEVVEVSDDYPTWYNALWLSGLLGIAALAGGLAYIGTRPNKGVDQLHGRIAAHQAESEYEAAKFMSRLR